MIREDIIRMAQEVSGVSYPLSITDVKIGMSHDHLERFANLVAAAEREKCARVLDEMADDMEREMEPSTAIAYVRSKAAAIRARGQL